MPENSAPEPAAPRRRKAGGRPFKKGESGNPGGVPKVVVAVRKLLEEEGVPQAVEFLRRVASGEEKESIVDDNGEEVLIPARLKTRVDAAKAILDFGLAKPKQEVGVSQGEGGPLEVIVHMVST